MNTARSELFEVVEREIATILGRARTALHERAVLVHPELNSSAYLCLMVLREHPDGCPQSRLVERLGLDKGVISRAVRDLEHHGFVARARDELDGRAYSLSLTEVAWDRLQAVAEARHAVFVSRFDHWADAELAELAASLRRYNDVFRSRDSAGQPADRADAATGTTAEPGADTARA